MGAVAEGGEIVISSLNGSNRIRPSRSSRPPVTSSLSPPVQSSPRPQSIYGLAKYKPLPVGIRGRPIRLRKNVQFEHQRRDEARRQYKIYPVGDHIGHWTLSENTCIHRVVTITSTVVYSPPMLPLPRADEATSIIYIFMHVRSFLANRVLVSISGPVGTD